MLLINGKLLGESEGPAAGDDGDLVDRVRAGKHPRHEGVARLVIGGDPLLLFADDHALALGAHHDLVLGVLEVHHGDFFLAQAGRIERCLVDEVLDIGAGKSRGPACNHFPVDVLGNDGLAHVHLEDLFPSLHVGQGHDDLPVETARSQKRRVEDVGAVRGRNEDDALVGFEAVHLNKKRVQGLLALVVAASQPCASVAADGVDLVDEDDAGGVLLALREKVPHAGGPDADEHLDEVRSADGEEGHVGLTGDGPWQEAFSPYPGTPREEPPWGYGRRDG